MSNILTKGILYYDTLKKVDHFFDSTDTMASIQTADENLRLRKINTDFIQIESSGLYVME